jgi:putative flippase GtrA
MATFGVVSITTTLIDFGLFNLLVLGDMLPAVAANTISYSVGILASYVMNKRLTFAGGGRERLSHEFGLFLIFNVGGLALNNLAVGLAVRVGSSTLALNVVKLIAGAVTWVLKFIAFKRWVYPMTRAEAEKG